MPIPTALTKANVDALAALILKGLPKNRACDLIGIHRTTLHKWLTEAETMGRAPKTKHERMVLYAYAVITKARAEWLAKIIGKIQDTGADDWRAWSFLAERQFPREFSEHKTVSADVTATVTPMLDALKRAAETIALNEDGENADST